MSKIFAQLPENMQKALATNAGLILKEFDPNASSITAETIRPNILFATTGGVSTTCAMTPKDFGEDVDNCPKNTKELMQVESYECKMSGTALTITKESATSLFGVADVKTTSGVDEISPRMTPKNEDFKTLWYVCPYGVEGGFVAIKLDNALSTGGFSMQSTDKEKAQFAFEYTGYSSIDTPDVVPFKFYIKATGTAMMAEVKAKV